MSGSIFYDHLDKEPKKYKLGEKVNARIVSIDPLNKNVSLSVLPHIMKMKNSVEQAVKIGSVFKNVKVVKLLYGNSYIVQINEQNKAFLHKTHLRDKVEGDDEKMILE
jgi:ribosomal protein S1